MRLRCWLVGVGMGAMTVLVIGDLWFFLRLAVGIGGIVVLVFAGSMVELSVELLTERGLRGLIPPVAVPIVLSLILSVIGLLLLHLCHADAVWRVGAPSLR